MSDSFVLTKKLDHIAFIMDGNGRWAKARLLPRHLGHKEACNRIVEIFDLCRKHQIKYASFFAFSTENWNRPSDEIEHLMDYLEEFFKKEIDYLERTGVKILVSGDISRIREKTRNVCLEAIRRTEHNSNWYFNICLNYGGRDEMLRASKKMALDYQKGVINLDDVNEETFKKYFWQPLLPDVDLLIRTSGEMRLSNFLLYQCAYAELIFKEVYWPDFKEEEFTDCLKEYQGRFRRYGGLKDE